MIELYAENGKTKLGIAKAKVLQASKTSVKHKNKNALKQARTELQVARLERAIWHALNPEPPYTTIPRAERRRLARELSS